MKNIPLQEHLLIERLAELNMLPSGLPPHVVEGLQAIIQKEADASRLLEIGEHAEVAIRRRDKLNKRIARLVTLKVIGRAFAEVSVASSPAETLPPPAPTVQKGGVA